MTKDEQRKLEYTKRMIKKHNLDLTGLTVFTECADGNYFYTSIAATLAGAERVWAYVPKKSFTEEYWDFFNIFFKDIAKNKILPECVYFLTDSRVRMQESDIITNSGNVRPITKEDISLFKKGAVIALMMQSDQVRPKDVDQYFCLVNDVECVPVNEFNVGIRRSMAFKTIKALFEAGLSVWNDRYVVCGNLMLSVVKFFNKNNIDFIQAGSRSCYKIKNINFSTMDAIIIHDYYNNDLWIGHEKDNPKISIEKIKKENPLIKIVNISGNVDLTACFSNNIDVFPSTRYIKGKTTISGDYLSHKVTIELNVAGLKAAEIVARKKKIS